MSWIVRIDGAVERKSLGCLSMITPRCGGMFTARSISPFCSAATRTASSGMGRKTTVLTCGAPRQYASLASRTSSSSFDQRTNLYGPVPMGFFEKSAVSFPADSLGDDDLAGRCGAGRHWQQQDGDGHDGCPRDHLEPPPSLSEREVRFLKVPLL